MKRFTLPKILSIALAGIFSAGIVFAQHEIRDVFRDPSLNLSNPVDRAVAAQRIKVIQEQHKAAAMAKAKKLGLTIRSERPDGSVMELVGFEGDEPRYYVTCNVNAAISTAANLVHTAPYSLDGSGVLAGVWDAGSARVTHQEFGGRVVSMDGAAADNHATHVAGTISAAGVVSNAKGMAFNTNVDSYNWTSDISEMTARAASSPGDLGSQVSVSNHSYSYGYGWNSNGGWSWLGTGTDQNAYENDFGRYTGTSVNIDNVAYNSPYYLGFWSAGNERNDKPSTGSTVTIAGQSYSYDPAIHPPGDGEYRGGFENIGAHGTSKNILTIGAANDAVTGGARDPAKATPSGFSSYGPVDDGRIKPDIMANGVGLYSPLAGSDTHYGTYSGTSMSSPNACGSTVLLIDHYAQLFSGEAMRASTLKGLIIHTATDLGNPGPDYKNGWGLMDVLTATELLDDHAAFPGDLRLNEDELTTANQTDTYAFNWDGSSPIRATICWTDPAGTSTSVHDNRTPRLVNDLNIKLIAPDATEYFPYVMPFVGTWTPASMDLPATTGVNNVDNVEQVYVPAPGQAGQWQVVVTYTGTLTNGQQQYGLLISGSAGSNNFPLFSADPINKPDGADYAPYSDSLAGTASDADGDPLTYSKDSGPAWLSVAANGALSGTPGPADIGLNTFMVRVEDGLGGFDTAALHITVQNAVNDAPTWSADPLTEPNALENVPYTGSISDDADDLDNDPLTFAKESGPAWLSVATDGTLSGTPATNDVGSSSFTVSVTDGIAAPVLATLNITVLAEGAATVIFTESFENPDVLDDGSTDPVGWVQTQHPNYVHISDENDTAKDFTSTPYGEQALTCYQGGGATATTTDTILNEVVEANTTYTLSFNVACVPGQSKSDYIATLLAVDGGGVETVLGSVTGVNDGTTDMSYSDTLVVSPTGNFGERIAIRLQHNPATDWQDKPTFDNVVLEEESAGGPSNQAPAWTVNPVNEADASEDAAYSSTLIDDASDADSDPLTFAKVSGPAWLNVAAGGSLSGTPANGDVGPNAFTVSVSDGMAPAVQATLNITVLNVNDAPTFTADPIVKSDAAADEAYTGETLAGSATDIDVGDTLTYAKTAGPAWLSVASDGTLTGTPGSTEEGLNTFTVQVNDGNGGTDTASLEITVTGGMYPIADFALSEVTTSGTVSGSLADTYLSDDVYEVLTEVESGGKPSNRRSFLEHEWTFDVAGGDVVTFYVQAHHTANSEGDDFVFAYSTDGINYTDMVTVSKTADDDLVQFFNLPGTISGTVYVRVTDTDQTRGNRTLDSLYVDEMFILSDAAGGPPAAATNPDPADTATGVLLNPTLSWTAGMLATSHDVYFGTNPVPGAGEFMGNQAGTSFDPGALQVNTTYYWAIDEVNGIGTTPGAVWSFTTGSGTPEMHVSSIVLSVQKRGKNYMGVATVTVVDTGTGLPVQGATVYGDFTGIFGESGSAVTDAGGEAIINTSAKEPLPFSFTFTVTDVTAAGYLYNPANNAETSDSGSF